MFIALEIDDSREHIIVQSRAVRSEDDSPITKNTIHRLQLMLERAHLIHEWTNSRNVPHAAPKSVPLPQRSALQ